MFEKQTSVAVCCWPSAHTGEEGNVTLLFH